MFLIPKEISSENKLWKSIYIKDFIIILGTLFFAWITSSAIYDGLVFQYYVFLLILSLLFILKVLQILVKEYTKLFIYCLLRII